MAPEHFDVLVVGAGVSGIGAAYRLQTECPRRSFTILEARSELGGTWDLFRFPGIRSDSDMSTLGYPFRPWTGEKSIADGASILRYLRETAAELGIDRHIRFDQRVVRASWSSETSTWTVEVEVGAAAPVVYTCSFLYACCGYYSYDAGYTPDLPGIERFTGTVVHPQEWPEDLDYGDRRVVIIGSGATAVTMLPAMAREAAKVTMLQRSPSYLLALPSHDELADRLRKLLPDGIALRLVRWKNVLMASAFYSLARRAPKLTRRLLTAGAASLLPPDVPVDPHFNPVYDPWDQRVCIVPDGDFFAALSSGRAEVVTDRIDTFTPTGIRLASGAELPADIVVTATGLALRAVGGIAMTVDGVAVDPAERYAYRGYMLSGVPNFAVRVRVRQRVVDASRGPELAVGVQAAELPGRARIHQGRADHGRRADERAPDPGPHGRVHPARRGPAAQAGSEVAVAAAAELRARFLHDPLWRHGPSHDVHVHATRSTHPRRGRGERGIEGVVYGMSTILPRV